MARKRGVATTRGFLKTVNKWTNETPERALAVFQEGSKDFYDIMAASTPVDTGHLRGSLIATVNTEPNPIGPTNEYRSEGNGAAQSYVNIDNAKLGDRINYSYLATYWRYVNYGTVNMAGRFWIEAVGAEYRSIMRDAARRLKMRIK